MTKRFPPINPKLPHFMHGGDYNPEQWMRTPEIWDEDMRLMQLAHCNVMTVGVFSWVSLEPEEGRFDFSWLDTIMDKLAENGMYAVLATPSGARPAWMSQKYPEVLRVNADGRRNLHGGRHNHCFTSPVYREKTHIINEALAKRYKDHPALLVWHVSNEYSGECHCDYCQEAFRTWLKQKYNHSLDELNEAWWTGFWSHTYTDWSQIESPRPRGETSVHGLNLDWKRFVTDQTIDFMEHEMVPLREHTPHVPITTNLMGTFPGLNYQKLARHIDVVSWDSYPWWHSSKDEWKLAASVAFTHDAMRSLKSGQPFMLMESTPSVTNWQAVSKLKRPLMHLLSSVQAVAHGADTVQYFQWRKSRGSMEKFHGAVVDHAGHENTRVFRDVTSVGELLEKLDSVVGTRVPAETAIIFDWENRWVIEDAAGPRQKGRDYVPTCESHYSSFWLRGIPVDVVSMDADLSKYKLVIAPMLHMIREGVAERIEQFVANGGTFVTTYWSGIVNDTDLCFLGGFPGPLREVTGVWSEEMDALYDGDTNRLCMVENNSLGLRGEYEIHTFADQIHAQTAQVLATYGDDFYAGQPALTVNQWGKGRAYYIAARTSDAFLFDFYGQVIKDLSIGRALDCDLPIGVSAAKRVDSTTNTVFVMNFTSATQTVQLPDGHVFRDLVTGMDQRATLSLSPYGVAILQTAASLRP